VGDQVRLCIIWHGFRLSGLAEEVLLSCSMDGGTSWSSPENVSRTPGSTEMSIRPAVALAASGHLHVAWQERLGPDPQWDYQVYYARSAPEVAMPLIARHWEAPAAGVLLRAAMRSD
jgi:hypothetical protein